MLSFIAPVRSSVQDLCWRKIFDLVFLFFFYLFSFSKFRAAHCKDGMEERKVLDGMTSYVGKVFKQTNSLIDELIWTCNPNPL